VLAVSNKWRLSDSYKYHTALQSIGVNPYQPATQDHNHQECCPLEINSPLQQERRFNLDSSTDSFDSDFHQTQKSTFFDNTLCSPDRVRPLTPSHPLSINYDGQEQKNFKKQTKGKQKLFPHNLFKRKPKKDLT